MADEQQTVRGVSWGEVFGFTQIFKTFKMAFHSGKLLLALAAIAITFVWGSYVMDPIWMKVGRSQAVMPNEAWRYWNAGNLAGFRYAKAVWMDETRLNALKNEDKTITDLTPENFEKVLQSVMSQKAADFQQKMASANADYDVRLEGTKNLSDRQREDEKQQIQHERARELNRKLTDYLVTRKQLESLRGCGIFTGFVRWEDTCLANAVTSVRRLNFTGGLGDLFERRTGFVDQTGTARVINRSPTPQPYQEESVTSAVGYSAAEPGDAHGLLVWLVLMAWGVYWMLSAYPLYAVIYILFALAVWSLCGGALCRMAALHAARDEKVSISGALRFSLSRFVSNLTAPLLPTAIILVLALVCLVLLVGLPGAIGWGVGAWWTALAMPLALVIGAAITFLIVGLAAGWPLMWPTIAVEGSDSFDALSRSYSYVYARPFRYAFYWVVAAVYGTVCYLFVRLFAFITLRTVHSWVGWATGVSGDGSREAYGEGASRLDVMWAQPTFDSFHGPMQTELLSNSETVAAYVLGFWVYLVAGIVLAFLASFVFCSATNIYYLLRREVDATDLEDVYIDEPEAQEPTPAEASAAVQTAEVKAAQEQEKTPEKPKAE